MKRPMPPNNLGEFINHAILSVVPSLELPAFLMETVLNGKSKLYNPDHEHLIGHMENSMIGFLWANGGYEKQGNKIIGLTEEVQFRCNAWQRMRMEQQLQEWFGIHLPDFIITLDARYCYQASDAEFLALVEHELYHIGHAKDKNGQHAYDRDTGMPSLKIRGHDVEEFIGVVERYGVGNNERLARLIEAGKSKPKIKQVDIQHACGTCLRLVA